MSNAPYLAHNTSVSNETNYTPPYVAPPLPKYGPAPFRLTLEQHMEIRKIRDELIALQNTPLLPPSPFQNVPIIKPIIDQPPAYKQMVQRHLREIEEQEERFKREWMELKQIEQQLMKSTLYDHALYASNAVPSSNVALSSRTERINYSSSRPYVRKRLNGTSDSN